MGLLLYRVLIVHKLIYLWGESNCRHESLAEAETGDFTSCLISFLSVFDPSSPSCGFSPHSTLCPLCLSDLLLLFASLNVIICTTIHRINFTWLLTDSFTQLANMTRLMVFLFEHVQKKNHSGRVVCWVNWPINYILFSLSLTLHSLLSSFPLVIRQSPWFCTHPPACCLLLPKPWCSPSWNQK